MTEPAADAAARDPAIEAFIARWSGDAGHGGNERASSRRCTHFA